MVEKRRNETISQSASVRRPPRAGLSDEKLLGAEGLRAVAGIGGSWALIPIYARPASLVLRFGDSAETAPVTASVLTLSKLPKISRQTSSR